MTALEVADHHVEHELAAVQDHIKNLIGKIQQREDKAETRIENLEGLVKKVCSLCFQSIRLSKLLMSLYVLCRRWQALWTVD